MIEEKDLRFLEKRKRFNRWGLVVGGLVALVVLLLLGYLLVNFADFVYPLFGLLFLFTAALLIYCFFRQICIERKLLKIIERTNEQTK